MRHYEPGKWGVSFAFTLKGSVFPKALAWAIPCACFAAGLHYVLSQSEELASSVNPGSTGTNLLGGFSFILGFLIVFRSQQAYNRWYQGCALLHQIRGEWRNALSGCIAFSNAAPDKKEEVSAFKRKLVSLFSLLYGAALSTVSERTSDTFEFLNLQDMDLESLEFLENSSYRCEIVLQWIQRLIVEAHEADVLKIAPPILSRVYNQLGNGIVVLNSAEVLNDFPVPFPLAQTVTFMLILHCLLTGLVVATGVESISWAAFIAFTVPFAYFSVHYIGMELERPFGDDTNDLPMGEMQEDFNRSLCELLHGRASRPPQFSFHSVSQSLRLEKSRACLRGYVTKSLSLNDEVIKTMDRPLRQARLRSSSEGSNSVGEQESDKSVRLVPLSEWPEAGQSASEAQSQLQQSPTQQIFLKENSYEILCTSEAQSPPVQRQTPQPVRSAEPTQEQQGEKKSAMTKEEELGAAPRKMGHSAQAVQFTQGSHDHASAQHSGAGAKWQRKEAAARSVDHPAKAENVESPWDQPGPQSGQQDLATAAPPPLDPDPNDVASI